MSSAASRPRRITAARRPARGMWPPGRRRRGVACLLQPGGRQDELVFDGRSAVFDANGEVVARAPQSASTLVTDIDMSVSHPGGCASRCRATCRRRRSCRCGGSAQPAVHGAAGPRPPAEPLREAGRCARRWSPPARLRRQNGFPGVIIGLSGVSTRRCAPRCRGRAGADRSPASRCPPALVHESMEGARLLAEATGIEMLCCAHRRRGHRDGGIARGPDRRRRARRDVENLQRGPAARC